MTISRPLAAAVLLCACLAGTLSCRRQETPDPSLTIALREPTSIDPAFLVASQDFLVAQQVHRMLFRVETESGQPQGDLVDELRVSADGRTCHLLLKSDARFQDGVPITAEIVARSIGRLANPSVASPGVGALVFLDGTWDPEAGSSEHTGIAVKGEYELDLTLSRPEPELASILASPRFSPVHPSVLASPSNDGYKVIGKVAFSGDYSVVQWTPRQTMSLRPTANPAYGNQQQGDGIELRFTESEDSAYTWWQTGEADIVVGLVPFGRIPEIRKEHAEALVTRVSRATYFLLFNTARVLWSDPVNRRIAARAINRGALVDSVLGAGQMPSTSFVPLEDFGDRFGIEACFPADMVGGERLETGSRALLLTNGSETLKLIGEYLQSELSTRSGLDVELRLLEWGSFLASLKAGDFDLARMTFTGGADPLELLENFTTGHSNNYGGFSDKAFDQQILLARGSQDSSQRAEHLAAAHRILCAQMPAIPVYLSSQVFLVSDRIGALPPISYDGWFRFRDVNLKPRQ